MSCPNSRHADFVASSMASRGEIGRMFAKLNSPQSTMRVALPLAFLCIASVFTMNSFAQAGASCVPNGSTPEVNACAVKQFQEADTALNIYYGDVMTALSAHERPQLRQDQNNWFRTRRDYCNRQQRSNEGKPEWERLYNECLVKVIQARRGALSQWLHTGNPPPPEASLPK